MAINHHRANIRDQIRDASTAITSQERLNIATAETAKIIAGMGQGPRPPCKRIDPNSPEGRAIAARYSG